MIFSTQKFKLEINFITEGIFDMKMDWKLSKFDIFVAKCDYELNENVYVKSFNCEKVFILWFN